MVLAAAFFFGLSASCARGDEPLLLTPFISPLSFSSLASQDSTKVQGAKNGRRHGGWQGQKEEVVEGKVTR
jgi:hypothetical protein